METGSIFIEENETYKLSEKQIETLLQSYQVNYPGLGILIVPELFDLTTKKVSSYVVWFDFTNRKVVHVFSQTNKSQTNWKNINTEDMIFDFFLPLKNYTIVYREKCEARMK